MRIAVAAVHVSDGNSARVVLGGSLVRSQGYKAIELAAVAGTADGFAFEYKKLGDVPGELCYSGGAGAGAAGALGAAWGFPSPILKNNHMGVGVEDTETVLVCRNHAEAFAVGGGHM